MERKKLLVGLTIIFAMIIFFFIAGKVPKTYIENLGLAMPLPMFTFLIALLDGFNPCSIYVLTFLLVLLISVSHSRRRILTVGYTFVGVIFVFYYMFMALWLNIFLFLGYADILRIIIALVAIGAGIINCKEYFFFRKGVTLMVQERHKLPLGNKIRQMKEIIKKGSMPALILASISLAIFASIVELPCTAGWPLIYTKILSEKVFAESAVYYLYLFFYNLIYVTPLAAIITIFGYFFKGKQISKEQMQMMKLIGGIVMLMLGIILLVNPGLLMLK